MATAQCSWRACTTFMPGSCDTATDQYMLASPIRVNSTSLPAAKACASMSDTGSLLIVILPLPLRLRSHERNACHSRRPPLGAAALGGGGGWRDGGAVAADAASGAAAGRCSATSFAMLAENSASRARAAWTPPASAKVSSGSLTVKLPSTASSVTLAPPTLTTPDASAREAPRPSMPRPSMAQVRAAGSKARLASPGNTATVGPNSTRIEPRHSPSPLSVASSAPGMHDATSARSLSSGQTSSAGTGSSSSRSTTP